MHSNMLLTKSKLKQKRFRPAGLLMLLDSDGHSYANIYFWGGKKKVKPIIMRPKQFPLLQHLIFSPTYFLTLFSDPLLPSFLPLFIYLISSTPFFPSPPSSFLLSEFPPPLSFFNSTFHQFHLLVPALHSLRAVSAQIHFLPLGRRSNLIRPPATAPGSASSC